jgi:hypothetical protein
MSAIQQMFLVEIPRSVVLPTPSNFWARYGYGGSAHCIYNSAIDSNLNIYLSGEETSGSLGIGFLIKISPDGVLLWDRKLTDNTSSAIAAGGITFDSTGNVYIAWAGNASHDFYLSKFNSSGTQLWQRTVSIGAYAYVVGQACAVDSSDNIYAMWSDGTSTALLKWNSGGTLQWQKNLSGGTTFGTSAGGGLYIDKSTDMLHLTATLSSDGTYYGCLIKLNSSGTIQWQRKYIGPGISFAGMGKANVDGSGNVYVSSWNSAIPAIIFIAKYNTSGTIQWQRNITIRGGSYVALTLGTDGFLYFVSQASDYAINSGDGAFYLAKYDTSGALQWERAFDGTGNQNSFIIVASTDHFVAAGQDAASGNCIMLCVKNDGSGTGTYGAMTYKSVTIGDSAGTWTDSAGIVAVGTPSYTEQAGAITINSGTGTWTKTNM